MQTVETYSSDLKSEIDQKEMVKTNPRILIVEDDLTLEPIWQYIIEKAHAHAKLSWATNEDEAENLILEALDNKEEFDLVITDIFLSGVKTGFDLWDRFHHLLQSRMIVTSGIEYNKFVKYLGNAKPQPLYIQKPLDVSDCIQAVYGALERARRI